MSAAKEFMKAASAMVAKCLSKPESYVAVSVQDSGGTTLSNTTCITHDFFNSGEYCSRLN